MSPYLYTLDEDRRRHMWEVAKNIDGSLPFEVAALAWIGRGVSYFKEVTYTGSVYVSSSEVVLAEGTYVLARARSCDVTTHRVPVYLGLGVRLDMGDQGTWYVQPAYVGFEPPNAMYLPRMIRNIRSARAITRAFVSALKRARPSG